MIVCGIVAEFNPFHNGHKALIDAALKNGADCVVCVMSGNYVQRGSFAVTDKRVRAKAALLGGADLIIELPLAFSLSTAQRFARGAVYLLGQLGCVNSLAFGSECGDIESLRALSKAIDSPEVTAVMRKILKSGQTFATARQQAINEIYGSTLSDMLSFPNNILAVEYLRQANLQGLKLDAFTIPRVAVAHDSVSPYKGIASASYLRQHANDFSKIIEFVPKRSAEIYADAIVSQIFPSDSAKLETAILTHLRRLSLPQLLTLPDLSEGIENRLYTSIRNSDSIPQLEELLKTKRYTMTRVRRLILSAFLGLTAADAETFPPYVRVLGFTPKGRDLLRHIKRHCKLPFDTSLAALRALGGSCERFASLEEISTDIYGLSMPKPWPCGYEYTQKGIYL